MSKLDIAVHSNKFTRVILNIFRVLLVVSAIFSVAMGIIGVVVHNRCGYYPIGLAGIPTMLKIKGSAADIPYGISTDSAFVFMASGSVFNVAAIIWFVNFIISSIINFADEFIKELIACISVVGAFIIALLLTNNVIDNKYEGIVYLGILALFIIALLCIKGTIGGRMLLYASVMILVQILAVPLVMWLISIGLRKLISGILIILVGGAVLIGITSSNGESSSGSSSSGRSLRSNDKQKAKIRAELERLNKKKKDAEDGLQKHLEGSISHAFVDENTARNEIKSYEKRKRELEKQLNK